MTANASNFRARSANVTVSSGATVIRNFSLLPLAVVYGDCSGDGRMDITDALFIAQATVGLRNLTPAQSAAADVSGDGKLDIVDALYIAQVTVGLRTL